MDAAGFSQNQLQRVSTLVLGQRGGLRKMGAALADPAAALRLLCLRLAVILCHARRDVDLAGVALQLRGTSVRLVLPQGWAEAHPHPAHLLKEEAAWAQSEALALAL